MNSFSKCHGQPPRDFCFETEVVELFQKLSLLQSFPSLSSVGYSKTFGSWWDTRLPVVLSVCSTSHQLVSQTTGNTQSKMYFWCDWKYSFCQPAKFPSKSKAKKLLANITEKLGKCFHGCCKICLNLHLFSTLKISQ